MNKEIKELAQLNIYMNPTIEEAIEKSGMNIEDRQDAMQSEILKNILSKCRIDIEKTRKDLVKPYNDIVKQINAKAKILIEPVERSEKLLNKKQIAYNEAIEEEKRKQQAEMDKLAIENDWKEEAEVEKMTIAQEANIQKVQRWVNYNKKIIKVDWELLPKQYRNIKDMEITPKQKEIKNSLKIWIDIPWLIFEE